MQDVLMMPAPLLISLLVKVLTVELKLATLENVLFLLLLLFEDRLAHLNGKLNAISPTLIACLSLLPAIALFPKPIVIGPPTVLPIKELMICAWLPVDAMQISATLDSVEVLLELKPDAIVNSKRVATLHIISAFNQELPLALAFPLKPFASSVWDVSMLNNRLECVPLPIVLPLPAILIKVDRLLLKEAPRLHDKQLLELVKLPRLLLLVPLATVIRLWELVS